MQPRRAAHRIRNLPGRGAGTSRRGEWSDPLLTDVAAVQERFGTPAAKPLARIDAEAVGRLGLPEGSMGPKVEAAARFAAATGGLAAIGALEDAGAVVAGRRGTRVAATPTPAPVSSSP